MHTDQRNMCKIMPLITLMLMVIIIQPNTCKALDTNSQNLTEVNYYHFNDGYYQLVKLVDESLPNDWILYETDIPYLNLSYTAPSDGLLQITLNNTEGLFPQILLSENWDTDGRSYFNQMHCNETSKFLLSPSLLLYDVNKSQIEGASATVWETYKWSNTSGEIKYSFTSFNDIIFELIMYPTDPKQGSSITFFTSSNSEINHIQWNFPEFQWLNESSTLEVHDLEVGTYTISVTGDDIFNNTHTAHLAFTVSPKTFDQQSIEIDFFSVSYPETVSKGAKVSLSATIDYSVPISAEIKCQLCDLIDNTICNERVYSVSDSGSKQFAHDFVVEEEGSKPLILKLYYDIGEGWVEVPDAERNLIVIVNPVNASTKIPGFNIKSVLFGLSLIAFFMGKQKNN